MGFSNDTEQLVDLVEVVESQTPEQREDVAHAIKGSVVGLYTDTHIGHHHKIRVSNLFGEIQQTFRDTFLALTAQARANNAPHRFRPDLRGNGTPRKRGKGQS